MRLPETPPRGAGTTATMLVALLLLASVGTFLAGSGDPLPSDVEGTAIAITAVLAVASWAVWRRSLARWSLRISIAIVLILAVLIATNLVSGAFPSQMIFEVGGAVIGAVWIAVHVSPAAGRSVGGPGKRPEA